jgi:N-carbamoyl-L-amino-acid hydrolase
MTRPDEGLAHDLFAQLQHLSFDGVGITRDTYGAGEQAAHSLVAELARTHGLEVQCDAALNLYITLPGQDRSAPKVMTGSHLDSVPRGGNYDGAAGVVAGLAILVGWKKAGVVPACDVTVVAIRAEESAWFPLSYIGSKSIFGLLDAQALLVCRFDTQRRLADHLSALGGQPDVLAQQVATFSPQQIQCFIELHIEQGPVLLDADLPVGIVTGICGSLRYRHAKVTGEYAHSGATPRSHRHDAVVATAELITHLHTIWQQMEGAGHELTLTFGQLQTDPQQADFSKVSGQVNFCIDIRSRSRETLAEMDRHIVQHVATLSQRHGVQFDLGPVTGSAAAQMDDTIQAQLLSAVQDLGCPMHRMPSGAGHDAAMFANQGIPTGMVFVRNAHGSHNPHEAMARQDFNLATQVLSTVLAQRAGLTLNDYERMSS